MNKTLDRNDKSSTWMRWFGLVIGSLAVGFWMFIVIGSMIQGPGPLDTESTILTLLILLSTFSVIVAWWHVRLGGRLVLASGLAHAIFALIISSQNQLLAASVSGGPFILSGILLLLSRQRRKESGASPNQNQSLSSG
ncbi:MAG: hypothetical protein GTO14_13430 [Anaerolineales bacterium]|nr:hypothetical protein [Anaerolineales bacterium]